MSSRNQQTSVLETTLKIAGMALGGIGGITGLAQLLRKPKVSGFMLEAWSGSVLRDDLIFDDEVMVNLTVSNRRFWQAAIVEWTVAIEGGEREFSASRVIPESYVISRPGFHADAPDSEWPIANLRTATAQPFKTTSGWLRFAFSNDGRDLGFHPQVVITATDNIGRKHRIEFAYRDTGCQVWDASRPGDADRIRQMRGPKPPID